MCKLCGLCADGGVVDQLTSAVSSIADYIPSSLKNLFQSGETENIASTLDSINHDKIAEDLKTLKLNSVTRKKMHRPIVDPTDSSRTYQEQPYDPADDVEQARLDELRAEEVLRSQKTKKELLYEQAKKQEKRDEL